MNSKLRILTNGIIKENPVLILVLGTCPTLAVTTSAINGLGMGLATTFVLVMSNILISMLKKVIPDTVRIPCYILVIATFVSIVDLLIQGFVPALASSLGIFIPLIVVNCIVLGRAEAFANKNSIFDSLLDGIGMGLGFTLALFIIGTCRELLGSGAFLGHKFIQGDGILVFVLAPGAFFIFGFVIAIVKWIQNIKN
jgi:electron transport complex protein RnfE